MAVLSLETPMARVSGVHPGVHDDLYGVQVHPLPGQTDSAGEADQVVQVPVYRCENL